MNVGKLRIYQLRSGKMGEKRFAIKSTATELELYDNGVKIGEFPHYEWVARPVDYVVKTLNEQQDIITELKSIINFASNEGDLIVLLMKEIIKLQQEVQECRAYETIEKGVSNYD